MCEEVAKILTRHKYSVELHRAEQTTIDLILKNKIFIFATSTWEHGRINPFFDKLLAAMNDKSFAHVQTGFIGLGDRRYEPVLFCEGIETLKRKILGNGAKQLGSLLKINGEPYDLLDNEVAGWTRGFIFELESENALAI